MESGFFRNLQEDNACTTKSNEKELHLEYANLLDIDSGEGIRKITSNIGRNEKKTKVVKNKFISENEKLHILQNLRKTKLINLSRTSQMGSNEKQQTEDDIKKTKKNIFPYHSFCINYKDNRLENLKKEHIDTELKILRKNRKQKKTNINKFDKFTLGKDSKNNLFVDKKEINKINSKLNSIKNNDNEDISSKEHSSFERELCKQFLQKKITKIKLINSSTSSNSSSDMTINMANNKIRENVYSYRTSQINKHKIITKNIQNIKNMKKSQIYKTLNSKANKDSNSNLAHLKKTTNTFFRYNDRKNNTKNESMNFEKNHIAKEKSASSFGDHREDKSIKKIKTKKLEKMDKVKNKGSIEKYEKLHQNSNDSQNKEAKNGEIKKKKKKYINKQSNERIYQSIIKNSTSKSDYLNKIKKYNSFAINEKDLKINKMFIVNDNLNNNSLILNVSSSSDLISSISSYTKRGCKIRGTKEKTKIDSIEEVDKTNLDFQAIADKKEAEKCKYIKNIISRYNYNNKILEKKHNTSLCSSKNSYKTYYNENRNSFEIYNIIKQKKIVKKLKKKILKSIKKTININKIKTPLYFHSKSYFFTFLKKLKFLLSKKVKEIKKRSSGSTGECSTNLDGENIYELFLKNKDNSLLLKKYLKQQKKLANKMNKYNIYRKNVESSSTQEKEKEKDLLFASPIKSEKSEKSEKDNEIGKVKNRETSQATPKSSIISPRNNNSKPFQCLDEKIEKKEHNDGTLTFIGNAPNVCEYKKENSNYEEGNKIDKNCNNNRNIEGIDKEIIEQQADTIVCSPNVLGNIKGTFENLDIQMIKNKDITLDIIEEQDKSKEKKINTSFENLKKEKNCIFNDMKLEEINETYSNDKQFRKDKPCPILVEECKESRDKKYTIINLPNVHDSSKLDNTYINKYLDSHEKINDIINKYPIEKLKINSLNNRIKNDLTQKIFYLNWCEYRDKQKRYEEKKCLIKNQRRCSKNMIRFGVKKQKYKSYTPLLHLKKGNHSYMHVPTNNSIQNRKINFIKNYRNFQSYNDSNSKKYNETSGNTICIAKKYDHNIINKIKKNISDNYNNMLTFLKNIFYTNFYLFNKKKEQKNIFKNRHINSFENDIKKKLQYHTNASVVPNIFLSKIKQNYENLQFKNSTIYNEPNYFIKNGNIHINA
ncbi:hypothetical protein YYG_00913 [Plasmodium vinckei petteri]|uniref:Uncharacterized protein n=1 Tax=Plasmodium vinckei petteri TaxID=138298 RepID=W7AQY5_PLAVN|nr:hypothetical protein YYG_00913 [Plasmodium vinckei petteri]CAD2106855.1 conserved Plasmodium protein, unknown function [Plasmodium vinckei petteri]